MNVRPPVVALACLAAAVVVDRLVPAPPLPPACRPLGAGLVAAGAALPAWALGLFRTHETTYEPFGVPTALVASGPYRFTRNPMYLGMLIALAGVALAARRLPILLAPAAFFALMDRIQIPREERLLEQRFVDSFRAYRRSVRRWL